MTLEDWVAEQVTTARGAGQKITRKDVLTILAAKSGVSFMTVAGADRGAKMGHYWKARSVSEATDWKVTIPELCGDLQAGPEVKAQFRALAQVSNA